MGRGDTRKGGSAKRKKDREKCGKPQPWDLIEDEYQDSKF